MAYNISVYMTFFERLENRNLLTYIADIDPILDINKDGSCTSNDVIQVINAINTHNENQKFDTNKDGYVSPSDALKIINVINHTPSHIIRVKIFDSDTVGFTDQQVLDSIDAAFEEYESIADIGFQYSDPYNISISTKELYLGNHTQARGLFSPPSSIFLTNGIFPPYHHSGKNGPINQTLYYKSFSDENAIQQIAGHEVGHYIFGISHNSNPKCRMNINAPPGFCKSEVDFLMARYGESKNGL